VIDEVIDRLVQQYDISFVSTGDVLRKEIAARSEVGKKAEAVVASGGGCLSPPYVLPPNLFVFSSMSRCSRFRFADVFVGRSGLVSDELMVEIVMAELDRLRGKVRPLLRLSSSSPELL